MSLNANTPSDPRSIIDRFGALENQGQIRFDGGPYVNGIFQTAVLTPKLQRRPSVLYPMPNLATTKKMVKQTQAFDRKIRAKGMPFLMGNNLHSKLAGGLAMIRKRRVVHHVRNVNEI